MRQSLKMLAMVTTLGLVGCTTTTVTVDGHKVSVLTEAPGFYSDAGILQRVHDATVKACSGYSIDAGGSRPPGYVPLVILGNFSKELDIADAVLEIGNKVHTAVQTWFGKTTITLTAKCRDGG